MKPELKNRRSNDTKTARRENVRPQEENAGEAKKGGKIPTTEEQLQDALSQIKSLQEQVRVLNSSSKAISPATADAIRLYKETAAYEEKCLAYVSKHIRSISSLCGDEIENVIYQSYRKDFGEAIDKLRHVLQNEIMESLCDEINL